MRSSEMILHTYLVGKSPFMDSRLLGVGAMAMHSGEFRFTAAPASVRPHVGRALAQYFSVRFRLSGWGGAFFLLFYSSNPTICQHYNFNVFINCQYTIHIVNNHISHIHIIFITFHSVFTHFCSWATPSSCHRIPLI